MGPLSPQKVNRPPRPRERVPLYLGPSDGERFFSRCLLAKGSPHECVRLAAALVPKDAAVSAVHSGPLARLVAGVDLDRVTGEAPARRTGRARRPGIPQRNDTIVTNGTDRPHRSRKRRFPRCTLLAETTLESTLGQRTTWRVPDRMPTHDRANSYPHRIGFVFPCNGLLWTADSRAQAS